MKWFYVAGDHCWTLIYAKTLYGVIEAMKSRRLSLYDFHTIRPATDEEWAECTKLGFGKIVHREK